MYVIPYIEGLIGPIVSFLVLENITTKAEMCQYHCNLPLVETCHNIKIWKRMFVNFLQHTNVLNSSPSSTLSGNSSQALASATPSAQPLAPVTSTPPTPLCCQQHPGKSLSLQHRWLRPVQARYIMSMGGSQIWEPSSFSIATTEPRGTDLLQWR